MEYWVSMEMCNEADLNWPVENHIICITLTEIIGFCDSQNIAMYCLISNLKSMTDIGDPSSIHFCLFYLYLSQVEFVVAVLVSVLSKF